MPLKLAGHSYPSLVTAPSQAEGGSLVGCQRALSSACLTWEHRWLAYQVHVEQRSSFKLGLEIKAGR